MKFRINIRIRRQLVELKCVPMAYSRRFISSARRRSTQSGAKHPCIAQMNATIEACCSASSVSSSALPTENRCPSVCAFPSLVDFFSETNCNFSFFSRQTSRSYFSHLVFRSERLSLRVIRICFVFLPPSTGMQTQFFYFLVFVSLALACQGGMNVRKMSSIVNILA